MGCKLLKKFNNIHKFTNNNFCSCLDIVIMSCNVDIVRNVFGRSILIGPMVMIGSKTTTSSG
jgi:hypothetical protein